MPKDSEFKVTKRGSFILEVKVDSQSTVLYTVKSFQLKKAMSNITQCVIAIKQIQTSTDSQNTYSSFLQLYNFGDIVTKQLPQCILYQVNQKSVYTQWFTGRVCSINPIISTNQGTDVSATCMCMGKACQLLFTYAKDYRYLAMPRMNQISTLQLMGVLGNNTSLSNFWRTGKISLQTLMLNSKQDIKNDNIAILLAKIFNSLQQSANSIVSNDTATWPANTQNKLPIVNLNEYIDSKYKASEYAASLDVGDTNPFLKLLDQQFINSTNGGTVLDAIKYAIGGNRLLTTVPSNRHDTQDKLNIIPTYIRPVSDDFGQDYSKSLTQDVTSALVRVNPISLISTPTRIYVNMSEANEWGQSQNSSIANLYGKYVVPGQDPNKARVKQIMAPPWLLSFFRLQSQNATKKQKGVTHTLRNKDRRKADSANIENSGKGISKDLTCLMNSYAKSVYYQLYGKNKTMQLSIIPTDYALELDRFIGESIYLYVPITIQDLKKKNYRKVYGRLRSVTYSYRTSEGIDKPSFLSVYIVLQAITFDSDIGGGKTFSHIFTDPQQEFMYSRMK